METDNILIELNNLDFQYNGTSPVLTGIDFAFGRNERIGITGPVGSGKTTLLYLIMGLLNPVSGTIKIFGKERKKEKDFIEVRQRIGFLFQNSNDQLFCPTVAEDIAFGPLNLEIPKPEVESIVKETLKRLDLEKYENRISYKLSFGEKKLISFATILAMRPEILLLDEPTNGLDSGYTEKIIDIITENFTSYIIISHNKDFLFPVCDKIYELNNNRLKLF